MTTNSTPRVSRLPTCCWRTTPITPVSGGTTDTPECSVNVVEGVETRAFRALAMSGMGKMKEAVKEIKAVLMKNMMNYTCWHIMGIIHRREK